MEISIIQQPDSAIARVLMDSNEEVTVQAGAMISMSNNVEISTSHRKGRSKKGSEGITRLIGGESLFLQNFKAKTNHCEVILAPPLPGDLQVYPLSTYKLIVQTGAFLACTSDVELFLGSRDMKATALKEPLYWLSLAGKGQVILTSVGALYEVFVEGEYIVTPGHIVAFESSLNYTEIKLNQGWLSQFSGAENIMWSFTGEGKLYCQTHHPHRLGRRLGNH